MPEIVEGDILWEPTQADIAGSNLTRYMTWLRVEGVVDVTTYRDLWEWSVTEIEEFWLSLWRYFEIVASVQPTSVLADRTMPGAAWFPGARLNYAENLFRHAGKRQPAILYQPESGDLEEISWDKLQTMTSRLVSALLEVGVEPGDRVVGFLPNIPETIAAFLATASIGAVWSSCPPDFGTQSVLDRFIQIEPKVLVACGGYIWAGKQYDRLQEVATLQDNLPSLRRTILFRRDGEEISHSLQNTVVWSTFMDDPGALASGSGPIPFVQVPFDHPLWVLYSSGTTGKPKPIVQGQGGILLEHLKSSHLQLDLSENDRFFWFTSTGWMMWNFLVGGLLNGTTIILYNGSPGYPNMDALWHLADATEMTYFGTGAAYILACMKAEVHPGQDYNLSALRALGSTGSPLPVAGFQWIYEEVKPDLALESVSGGTDLCTAFIGGARLQPIYAGELQGPSLGARVESYNGEGESVIGEVGELVITEPMPSMPLYFWNDHEMMRYRESYFEMFPGIWRHGDWLKINERNGCVIYGRSDSTINRQGIRMGTSEIYQAVESFDEILDSLIIDLESLGRDSYMPLFVVLRPDSELTADLMARINAAIRRDISPRHVPNDIFEIDEVPYTLSGKKMEVPVRKILLGQDPKRAANQGAMRNPESLGYFVDFAGGLNT